MVVGRVSYWLYGSAWVAGYECSGQYEEEHGECDGIRYVLCWADRWYVLFHILEALQFPSFDLG